LITGDRRTGYSPVIPDQAGGIHIRSCHKKTADSLKKRPEKPDKNDTDPGKCCTDPEPSHRPDRTYLDEIITIGVPFTFFKQPFQPADGHNRILPACLFTGRQTLIERAHRCFSVDPFWKFPILISFFLIIMLL
jgi:hypothetical protein